jgi:hypothetical protein
MFRRKKKETALQKSQREEKEYKKTLNEFQLGASLTSKNATSDSIPQGDDKNQEGLYQVVSSPPPPAAATFPRSRTHNSISPT